ALFQKERIALGAGDQQRRERCQTGGVAEQRLEQRLRAHRRQRSEPQLRIGGRAAPAVLILGAVIDQEQELRCRYALDEAVEQGLGLGIHPVQVFKDQEQRLHLAFAQQQALDGVQRPLSALRGIEGRPLRLAPPHPPERQGGGAGGGARLL